MKAQGKCEALAWTPFILMQLLAPGMRWTLCAHSFKMQKEPETLVLHGQAKVSQIANTQYRSRRSNFMVER